MTHANTDRPTCYWDNWDCYIDGDIVEHPPEWALAYRADDGIECDYPPRD